MSFFPSFHQENHCTLNKFLNKFQIFQTKLANQFFFVDIFGRVFSLVGISKKNVLLIFLDSNCNHITLINVWLMELITCWLIRESRLSSMFSTRIFPPCAKSSTPPDLLKKKHQDIRSYVHLRNRKNGKKFTWIWSWLVMWSNAVMPEGLLRRFYHVPTTFISQWTF